MRGTFIVSLEYLARQFAEGRSLERDELERLRLNGQHLLAQEQRERLEQLTRTPSILRRAA